MSAHKRLQHTVDVDVNTFKDTTGLIQTFKATYSLTNVPSECQGLAFLPVKNDPVIPHNKEANKPPRMPIPCRETRRDNLIIEPSISTRLHLEAPPYKGLVGTKYKAPEPRGTRRLKQEARNEFKEGVHFCEWEVVRLPSPTITDTLRDKVEMKSPETSHAKVKIEKPSYISPSVIYPEPPSTSKLELHKPKSGIFINVGKEASYYDDEERSAPRSKKAAHHKKSRKHVLPMEEEKPSDKVVDFINELDYFCMQGGEEEMVPHVLMESRSTHVSDNLILGKYGEILSQASSATSIQDRELETYSDVSWCELPLISKLVQTIRDAQQEQPRRKYIKGALENHSFTKIKQNILDSFYYSCIAGTIHQGDMGFMKCSRNRQGICMPIAAFCYAQLYDANYWTSRSVDEIIELGNVLFMDSTAELHLHRNRKELTLDEVKKVIIIHNRKVKYEVSEPEFKGLVRSMDKRIFNLTTALRMFFMRQNSCILRTLHYNFLIWKLKKCKYFMFDSQPRKNNLAQDPNGAAILIHVHNFRAVISILLERTDLSNSPFNLSYIRIINLLDKDEEEMPPYISDNNTYKALNDRQAVVQGSFDLGDLCFMFTRNKQALAMSLIALVYSRISAPHSWHRKTVDKILIIGNQLHTLCMEAEGCNELGIEHLPAIFSLGPYIVEIHIYANRFADIVYRKGVCTFVDNLKMFMLKNNNALVQIGKSYLGIWQQRDMYFCFDAYARNKQGLKCRQGTACVTMNRDLDILVETVLSNFENREAIFYIHAMKVLKIHRDPQLTKVFPRHTPLQDLPLDTFKKHKMCKSKHKAVEPPVRLDFTQHALRRLLVGESPQPSILEVGSNVLSIDTHILPPMEAKLAKIPVAKVRLPEDDEHVVDLDSPSLSDTQIVPKRPTPYDVEEILIDDLDSFGLTEEEKELEEVPEGAEGAVIKLHVDGMEEEGKTRDEETLSRYGVMSQVTSGELDPCYCTHFINTDLTYCYKILPAMELPVKTQGDREIVIDEDDQNDQFARKRHFTDVDENMQILRGKTDALTVCEDECINLVVPYMCIMASAFAIEVPLYRWQRRTIDFILKAGLEIYKEHHENFIRIEDFKFELERNNLFAVIDIIFNTYIGQGLFDTYSGQKVLEQFLVTHVFNREDCGFIIMPFYACAVFFKRNLFYYFEPYNCDKQGRTQADDDDGNACLMRFKTLDSLIQHLVDNLSKRVERNDKTNLEFRMLTLAKPIFTLTDESFTKNLEEFNKQARDDELLQKTQSEELKRPSNFVTLPDGSHLIRGAAKVHNYGVEVEYIAPFMCAMAAPIAEKYAIRTWSGDVIDYVLQTGNELYKRAKYRFTQLARLDIPKISLGHTDYKISIKYIFDAPMKLSIMKAALKRILAKERDWIIIVTELYSCAIFQRNGLLYLFDPFPCNEIGLDDGLSGNACVARFRNMHDLCIRILFNKNKREKVEAVDYTRFVLSVCRATRIYENRAPRVPGEEIRDEEDAMLRQVDEGEEGDIEDAEEEPEVKEERRNKIGYEFRGQLEVLEANKSLNRPSGFSELADDHFVCLVACLMVVYKPLAKWDTKTIDKVLELGRHIYLHADNLEISKKRTIKNILIGKYFFDIIVQMIEINDWKHRRNFETALKFITRKRKFCILQTGEGTYVVYVDMDTNIVHLFHPYKLDAKNTRDDEEQTGKEMIELNACWIKFRTTKAMLKFLRASNSLSRYIFYSFVVINVTKAPRSIIVSHIIQDYIQLKQNKGEILGKPFHEHESWMDLCHNPWARLGSDLSGGVACTRTENKWFNWDVEYRNDLYSMIGTIHQNSREFRSLSRGKQTLANVVMAIGMTGIYDIKEWNSSVIDAVLYNGDKYFLKCIEHIDEADYELSMDDLLPDCEIFPYKFKIHYTPVIEGTMFLNHPRKFNLYKALRYFFDDYYYRAGVICSSRHDNGKKRVVSFAKRRESEYFMFDCQAFGPPMFQPRHGSAYMLRCTTLARLVHILVLTLRGGDFYIYEVIADSFEPMKPETDDEQDDSKRNDDVSDK